ARMKASMGLATQAVSFTTGASGRLTGWNAQWARSLSVISNLPRRIVDVDATVFSWPGQGAPILTHSVRSAICWADRLALGGGVGQQAGGDDGAAQAAEGSGGGHGVHPVVARRDGGRSGGFIQDTRTAAGDAMRTPAFSVRPALLTIR